MSRADETIRAPQRVWAVATAAEDEPGEQRLGTPSAVDAIVRMVLADCSGHINVLLRNLLLLRLSNAPVAGRNSFTEGQAKSKIEDAGFTGVSELKKDDNGVWRGKANKGGTATSVSVDFQGNVNTAK